MDDAGGEAAEDEAAGDAGEQVANGEDRPERKRATAANLNLDAEPVVVSDSAKESQAKPKRAGWWARGKGFF